MPVPGYSSSVPRPRPRWRIVVPGRRRAWWCGLLLMGVCASALPAQVSKEYQLKAAFLFNFTKFVEWPAARFAGEAAPIVIAVVGRNPFGDELEKIVRDRTVNGRTLVIARFETAREALLVHAVFIAAGEEQLVEKQIGPLIDAGVLVVGESERLAALGGAVTFKAADDKVRFEINLATAERGGLKVSAQLLKLATAVRRQSGPRP